MHKDETTCPSVHLLMRPRKAETTPVGSPGFERKGVRSTMGGLFLFLARKGVDTVTQKALSRQ